jgi:hypothetical protein
MVAGISAISFSVMPRAHKVVIPITNVKGVTSNLPDPAGDVLAFETLSSHGAQDVAV